MKTWSGATWIGVTATLTVDGDVTIPSTLLLQGTIDGGGVLTFASESELEWTGPPKPAAARPADSPLVDATQLTVADSARGGSKRSRGGRSRRGSRGGRGRKAEAGAAFVSPEIVTLDTGGRAATVRDPDGHMIVLTE